MTKVELRRMLLAHLTVIDAQTQAPPTEVASLADLWIDGARAELSEKGLVWWDENSIPDAPAVPFMRYVASQCCGAFGRANKGFEAQEQSALARLAGLKSTAERPTVRAEYF